MFIKDDALRESIRQDVGAAKRALNNAEWKAATVLAGAAIEALLHWRLKKPPPDAAEVDNAVNALTGTRKMPFSDIDRWDLDQFIEGCRASGLAQAGQLHSSATSKKLQKSNSAGAGGPTGTDLRPRHGLFGHRRAGACHTGFNLGSQVTVARRRQQREARIEAARRPGRSPLPELEEWKNGCTMPLRQLSECSHV